MDEHETKQLNAGQLLKASTRYIPRFISGRISTSQGNQYSANADYMRQNGTVRQIHDTLLVKFMCLRSNLMNWRGH